jgi:hypothetical protein
MTICERAESADASAIVRNMPWLINDWPKSERDLPCEDERVWAVVGLEVKIMETVSCSCSWRLNPVNGEQCLIVCGYVRALFYSFMTPSVPRESHVDTAAVTWRLVRRRDKDQSLKEHLFRHTSPSNTMASRLTSTHIQCTANDHHRLSHSKIHLTLPSNLSLRIPFIPTRPPSRHCI